MKRIVTMMTMASISLFVMAQVDMGISTRPFVRVMTFMNMPVADG